MGFEVLLWDLGGIILAAPPDPAVPPQVSPGLAQVGIMEEQQRQQSLVWGSLGGIRGGFGGFGVQGDPGWVGAELEGFWGDSRGSCVGFGGVWSGFEKVLGGPRLVWGALDDL